jgi:hypothetical protein
MFVQTKAYLRIDIIRILALNVACRIWGFDPTALSYQSLVVVACLALH